MGFQSTVNFKQGFGVVGEFYLSSPQRVQSYILSSALASYNVFGRGFSVEAQGVAAAGNPGGTAIYAGILVNPKAHPSLGDGVNTLNPSLVLPNNVNAELATEGSVIVSLPAGANIGDWVVYDNSTGILSTIAPGADLPVGKSFAYATVDYYTVAVDNSQYIAVITLTPTLTIPVLA